MLEGGGADGGGGVDVLKGAQGDSLPQASSVPPTPGRPKIHENFIKKST